MKSTHSLFNATSAFGAEAATTTQTIISAALIAFIAAAYAVYIAVMVKDKEDIL